jgi:hypothetical protein
VAGAECHFTKITGDGGQDRMSFSFVVDKDNHTITVDGWLPNEAFVLLCNVGNNDKKPDVWKIAHLYSLELVSETLIDRFECTREEMT